MLARFLQVLTLLNLAHSSSRYARTPVHDQAPKSFDMQALMSSAMAVLALWVCVQYSGGRPANAPPQFIMANGVTVWRKTTDAWNTVETSELWQVMCSWGMHLLMSIAPSSLEVPVLTCLSHSDCIDYD